MQEDLFKSPPPCSKRNETEISSTAGIKVEAGYPAYERGLQADVFVQYPDGTPVLGQVWPGPVHYPDFVMHALTGDYWQEQLARFHQVSNSRLRLCVHSTSPLSSLVLLVFARRIGRLVVTVCLPFLVLV